MQFSASIPRQPIVCQVDVVIPAIAPSPIMKTCLNTSTKRFASFLSCPQGSACQHVQTTSRLSSSGEEEESAVKISNPNDGKNEKNAGYSNDPMRTNDQNKPLGGTSIGDKDRQNDVESGES